MGSGEAVTGESPDSVADTTAHSSAAPVPGARSSRHVTRLVGIGVATLTILLLGRALLTPAAPAPASLRSQRETPLSAAPEVGHLAPDVPLVDLSNNHVLLSSLRGNVVILNFWYVACEPCRLEMPVFERIYHVDGDRGVVVIGVNVSDDPQTISAFLAQLGIDYPILRDVGQRAVAVYRVTSTPTTFFIDRQGVIRGRYVGALTDTATVNGYIAPLLARA
jgi:peroxiredoxin